MSAHLRRWFSAALLFALAALPRQEAAAQANVTFTLTIKSAFARSAPSMAATRVASLFRGQTVAVTGQTADGVWLRLDYTGLRTEAWISKSLGKVGGDLKNVPVVESTSASAGPGATPSPASPPAPAFQPGQPVIPAVSQTARSIYQRGLQMGNNPRHFSKVGDCQTVPPYFLASFDYGAGMYSLGSYGYLQEAIDHFSGSFARNSVATNSGFNVASVFVPFWSDASRCLNGEAPLACELRLNRPSLVIISMETWWGGSPAGYESYMRRIIEYAIGQGAVPILGTKADNVEGDGSINATIVKLAQEYDIPLWNFWAAVQPLPNHGLHPDGFHLTWERNYFDDPARLEKSWPVRNLTALQAIDAVWRGVAGR